MTPGAGIQDRGQVSGRAGVGFGTQGALFPEAGEGDAVGVTGSR